MLDKCSTTDILLFCLFSFVWGRAHAHHILHVVGRGGGAEDNLEKSILSFNSVNTGALN